MADEYLEVSREEFCSLVRSCLEVFERSLDDLDKIRVYSPLLRDQIEDGRVVPLINGMSDEAYRLTDIVRSILGNIEATVCR